MNTYKIISITVLIFIYITFTSCFQAQDQEKSPNYASAHDHEHSSEEHDHEHSDDEHDHEHSDEAHEAEEGKKEHKHDSLYHIIEIKPRFFYDIIRTSGQIEQAQGDEITLSAMHDGVVLFNSSSVISGEKVKNGMFLLTISGNELIHDNMETKFLEVKNRFEKAKADFQRVKPLHEDKIISDKEFLEVKSLFENAKNEFKVVKQNYAGGGRKVAAPINGFIKNVFVTEGQFVQTGQALLSIAKNKRLMLTADISLKHFGKLPNIKSANFATPYDNKTYDIESMNGRLISYSRTTGAHVNMAQVYFEVDNMPGLVPGSFIEVFLKTNTKNNAIVVPKTALLEEMGSYYVFVENSGNFQKRYVRLGGSDGKNVEIVSGLFSGEHLVTANAFRIKLAMLSSSLPAHTHSH